MHPNQQGTTFHSIVSGEGLAKKQNWPLRRRFSFFFSCVFSRFFRGGCGGGARVSNYSHCHSVPFFLKKRAKTHRIVFRRRKVQLSAGIRVCFGMEIASRVARMAGRNDYKLPFIDHSRSSEWQAWPSCWAMYITDCFWVGESVRSSHFYCDGLYGLAG